MEIADSHERVVLVTGGGTGIGRATAKAFIELGDEVVITGRRRDVLDQAASEIGAIPVAFDASDPDDIGKVLADLPKRIDVLVNNAGGNTNFDREDADDDLAAVAASWRANLDSNLLTAVLMTKALEDRITNGGRVVNVGSIAASSAAGSYGAAKAAVETLTFTQAASLGARGITANVVAPGLILDTDFFRGNLTSEKQQALIEATCTGRAGRPEDVAATVVFLASEKARHVTGQVVHVNGGAHHGR